MRRGMPVAGASPPAGYSAFCLAESGNDLSGKRSLWPVTAGHGLSQPARRPAFPLPLTGTECHRHSSGSDTFADGHDRRPLFDG